MSVINRVIQLITNPATGRLSTSDTLLVGAWVASTFVLIYSAIAYAVHEGLFIAYLGAWVAQNQASKQAAIKRDREIKRITDYE